MPVAPSTLKDIMKGRKQMKIKGLNECDIVNYKKTSMFIVFPHCSFKCDKECGRNVCQNSALACAPIFEIDTKKIIERYVYNPLTKALVCGGLEPFDSWEELQELVSSFRQESNDEIVIYTGYTEEEIEDKVNWLKLYSPITIKYGRFIPNQEKHYDKILGVDLASPNQYAKEY